MLKMLPNCACCDCDLPPTADNAMICSFECTFCVLCVEQKFDGACPNCGGLMCARPTRVGDSLRDNPAAEDRVRRHYEITFVDGEKVITSTVIS